MPTENAHKADDLIDVGEADQQATEINLGNKGEPEKVEASVFLTKWQLEKMLRHYGEDAHPSDLQQFKTVVKREADGWRISSTHLAKGAEKYPLPSGKFYVIDASYIDHHGDFKSCIDYAHSYKDHHEYIVVSPK